MRTSLAIACGALLAAACLEGQTSPFRDPEDGAFDVGGWISTRTGILPIPAPITEPAVGYGGSLTLVLIHGGGIGGDAGCPARRDGEAPCRPTSRLWPGPGTENGTWAVLGAHQGFWGGGIWRYTGVVGRISPRARHVRRLRERAYGFNLDGWTIYQELRRARRRAPNLFLGARLRLPGHDDPLRGRARAARRARVPSSTRRDSGLGAVAEFDTRDNIVHAEQRRRS